MFRGERIDVTRFVVEQQLSSRRVRLVADVNGVRSFVKTFGDPVVQCTADELKRLVGLTPLGVCRATVQDYGEVLIARYLPDHQRFNDLQPDKMYVPELLHILWFDVWIRNNDRTGTNVLLMKDGSIVPIDESAAFKRESTFRMTPKRPWYGLLAPAAAAFRPSFWPPPARQVTETVRRCDPQGWAALSWVLVERLNQMPTYWHAFWEDAKRRMRSEKTAQAFR